MTTETIPAPVDTTSDTPVAHVIFGADAAAKVTEAVVYGIELVALCGMVFIPGRDHQNLPVCQRCVEIRDGLLGR